MKDVRLTWRKQPNESGLKSVGQGPRGAILKCDGKDVGRVYALRVDQPGIRYRGWIWTASSETVLHKNTWDTPVEDLDQAKRDCEAYVREQLSAGGSE